MAANTYQKDRDYSSVPTNSNDSKAMVDSDNTPPERAAWDSKLQYFFMVISYAIGLGNIWRFPYLTQQHGGGAFLIPYFIMLFVEGMPLLYLEMAIGQKMRTGSVGVWNKINPAIAGIGAASCVVSFVVGIYYNAVIMWCLFYLVNSFTATLPWSSCPTTIVQDTNITVPVAQCEQSGSTSYYWYHEALDISSGIDNSGGINWKILLCLISSWILIFLCICKGIKTSGKVVYFTATFPYVVLLIFFVRGLMLRGSTDGLAYMFTPKLERLADPQCWLDAATQIFYSFGLGFGSLIAFSSYNPSNNNFQFDTIIVSIVNWCTAIFACAVIFAILGFKATLMYENCLDHNIGILVNLYPGLNITTLTRDIYLETFSHELPAIANSTNATFRHCSLQDDLDKGASGTGLAFILFTQAITEFGPSAPFWSIVFFLMLLSLGFGTEIGVLEGVSTAIYDLQLLPFFKKEMDNLRFILLSAMLCGISCLIGLVFVQGSGYYWVGLFDAFSATFPLVIIAIAEAISVSYIYGLDRFSSDVKVMLGHPPSMYWKILLKFVAPLVLISLLIATIVSKFSQPIVYSAYNRKKATLKTATYPWYGLLVCALLVLMSVLWIPGVAIYRKRKQIRSGTPTTLNKPDQQEFNKEQIPFINKHDT